MLAEDLVLVLIGEPLAKAEPTGEPGQGPTSRAWPPRQGQEGALAADGALGVGDGAALLPRRRQAAAGGRGAPCRCWPSPRRPPAARSGSGPRAPGCRPAGETAGLVPSTQSARISPVHRLEQLDGLVPRPAHHGRASPEALYPIALGLAKAHVGGELGREPPTSRPPMALGCPVMEKGAAPACRCDRTSGGR